MIRGWLIAALAVCCLLPQAPQRAVAAASIDCMNRDTGAWPVAATLIGVAEAPQMQQLLDRHRQIRLLPAGDYRRATGIVLKSGQAIYGAAGTRIGRVIVAPGTQGAILSGVVPEALEFPPSALSTRENCFERFAARHYAQAPLRLANAVVERNLFLDNGRIVIDTERSGSVRNNRFIRTLVHGEAPVLELRGRLGGSDSNVFLWVNALGPEGDGMLISGQRAVNLVGFDAENWNSRGLAKHPAMLNVRRTGTLRVLMAHGGDPKRRPSGFMDVDATEFELLGMTLFGVGNPALRLGASVRRYDSALASGHSRLVVSQRWEGYSAFPAGDDRLDLSGIDAVSADALQGSAPVPRSLPWAAPVFPAMPDPAGREWRSARSKARDARAELQQAIDTQGIALLPAGIYHVSGSLRLKNGQGLIGAGAGSTAIVALRENIDLLVSDERLDDKRTTSLVLMDLTLQGGRSGIRHDEQGAGRGAQFNLMHLSHVSFRDMSEAGIVVEGIYGWDNNLLDNLNFVRMPVGILQRPSSWYVDAALQGDVAGMNYMDKNVCYRCRFEALGVGMQLTARRANGLNACIDCRFVRNTAGALSLYNNLSTLIANSDFIDNGGKPVIASNQLVGITGSRFVVGKAATAQLDHNAICEACEFHALPGASGSIGARESRLMLVRSRLGGQSLLRDVSGLLVDSVSGDRSLPVARLIRMRAGVPAVVQAGQPDAAPRLLADDPP